MQVNIRPALYEIGDIIGFVDLIEQAQPFPTSETARWFCAIVNPNCQARACLGLHEIGYRTFYPKVRRWVSHARVKTAKEKPLLGRYIFVEVDHPAQSFGSVRATNGIEALVSNPDPIPIPQGYVERLRERYMDGEWDYVAQHPVPFINKDGEQELRINEPIPIGARIRLMEGEFADMLATITAKEGRRGRKIVFKLFNENRYGSLPVDDVRAA